MFIKVEMIETDTMFNEPKYIYRFEIEIWNTVDTSIENYSLKSSFTLFDKIYKENKETRTSKYARLKQNITESIGLKAIAIGRLIMINCYL